MDRRTLIKTGGMAIVGLGFGGCVTRQPGRTVLPRPPVILPPVHVSWDRVIRTTVGLRPHRDSGFVLKADKLDAKTLIHNYGHGGAGMSLSWGTGLMAAEFALQADGRRAAVVGCGAVGLTCARQLQRRGFDVTIYAMAVPPDTTSNMSLAGFTPTSGLIENDRRTPEWEGQFRRAAEIAYRQLQLLAGSYYGVSWVNHYTPMGEVRGRGGEGSQLLQASLQLGQVLLQPGEHPFPTKYAVQRPSMRIEPSIYLDALVRDFLLFGGHVVIRKFDTPRDLMSLTESVIVNCTGLGAKALFGDEELVPLKGQLTVLVPQPEVTYATNGGTRNPSPTPGIGIHMMPRTDGIVLGGTSQRDVWTFEPDENERKRVVEGHMQLFSAMHAPPFGARIARAEPPLRVPSLESHFGLEY
ncbi:MAG: FAD-dependent oxidoreductase [Acidobacteria bacterium]|nr:FAD-dependent oxidoreductase [Acidobacteriota bacterium]MBI3262859.1 FAD-dependent oxidoreductase [Acidobacteriota bacterium]